jgi:tetratricopeptide (TPR) repeat protein
MAEGGLIEGVLGAEGEEREAEASVAGSDAFAAAAALEAARHDPELARKLGDYFDKQSRLAELQLHHFEEERLLAIGAARRKRFSDRLKNGLQLIAVVVAAGFAAVAAAMFYDAFTSHSVVVDAFDAPSSLAQRGITGKLAAVQVLDSLQTLQAATRAQSQGLNAKGAWESEVKIEVPQTGVSVGDLERLLHDRFGHDLHIEGALAQTAAGGLTLTVRGDDAPVRTFEGPPDGLDKLTAQAAEYIYGRAQPMRMLIYLVQNNRSDDAIAFGRDAYPRIGARDRAEFVSWQVQAAFDHPQEAIVLWRRDMDLWGDDPRKFRIWRSEPAIIWKLDGDEAAWRETRVLEQALAKARLPANLTANPPTNPGYTADVIKMDFDAFLKFGLWSEKEARGGTYKLEGSVVRAIAYRWLHDPAAAAEALAESNSPDNPVTRQEALLLAMSNSLDHGDSAAAAETARAYWKVWLDEVSVRTAFASPCTAGLALGLAGSLDEAQAVFDRIGPNYMACWAARGQVLEHAGDLAAAERAWAEGIRIGPDLAPVYLARGHSELNRGLLKAAEADLAAAGARAPHFADALKAWGDVLLKEGRRQEALAKYDEALKYAPAWTELKTARDVAGKA